MDVGLTEICGKLTAREPYHLIGVLYAHTYTEIDSHLILHRFTPQRAAMHLRHCKTTPSLFRRGYQNENRGFIDSNCGV